MWNARCFIPSHWQRFFKLYRSYEHGEGVFAKDDKMTKHVESHVRTVGEEQLWYMYIEGILPKGPYPPCLRIADRALLAGYLRYMNWRVGSRYYPIHPLFRLGCEVYFGEPRPVYLEKGFHTCASMFSLMGCLKEYGGMTLNRTYLELDIGYLLLCASG